MFCAVTGLLQSRKLSSFGSDFFFFLGRYSVYFLCKICIFVLHCGGGLGCLWVVLFVNRVVPNFFARENIRAVDGVFEFVAGGRVGHAHALLSFDLIRHATPVL